MFGLRVFSNALFFWTLSKFCLWFTPHRIVDEAYNCYRPSSVVCQSAGLSVGLSRYSELCKTPEPIEIPFGLWARVDPRNHVLDGGPCMTHGKGQFLGERKRPIVRYIRNLPVWPVQTAELVKIPFGMLSRLDPGNHALDGSADVPTEMQSIGFGGWVKGRAAQKQLHRC